MKEYNSLAISSPDELIFGRAAVPVTCGNNLIIGSGLVFPEINFTLPIMKIDNRSWIDVVKNYDAIITSIVNRTVKLNLPGLVVEFEQLPPMTMNPDWGAEITALLKNKLDELFNNFGIPNALRVTIVDLRDSVRPPQLRDGESWYRMKSAFELCAEAGADILSIESVGGKEIHDEAIIYGDLQGIAASLGILGYKDMCWLWDEISAIAKKYKIIPGGDSACGFANTAMQLAGQGLIPSVLAAVDRAATIPRSLAAYEHGAIGPSKDCAYEGPYMKAITGYPISMEGKSACCAHFSPIGNIAGYAADLWSNESVQNIKLLSGSAPEAFLELLAYDCRLFNTSQKNSPQLLKEWLIDSDVTLSPEALMLEPNTVIRISKEIIKKKNSYERTVTAIEESFNVIREWVDSQRILLNEMESGWLYKIGNDVHNLFHSEDEAIIYLNENYGHLFNKKSYDIN